MKLVKDLPPCTIYARQKAMAKIRNIEWDITFQEWYSVWEQSGKYAERGKGKGKYVMSRVNDIGAYKLGNVFIQLNTDNVSQASKGKKQPDWLIANRVAKITGVKHSEERRMINSLAQKNSPNNYFKTNNPKKTKTV
jgi:hypothetical protein